MPLPAYSNNNRDRRHGRNSRSMPSGFSDGQRFQRLPLDTFGHSEPPSDFLFNTTYDNFFESYEARQREDFNRAVEEQVQAKIRLEQEKSRNGTKRVNLDDDEEDPDFVPMGDSYSALDNPPQTQVRIVYVEKFRKRKKRRRNSSSSSVEGESNEIVKHKKRKKRRRESDSEAQEDENSQGTSRKFMQNSQTAFDFSRNPWRLLRRNEYAYNPSHMVVDMRSDLSNLQFEQPYKSEVADYLVLFPTHASLTQIRAVSEILLSLLYKPEELLISKDDKCYAEVHLVNWNRQPVERFFRHNNDCTFSEFVALSHQPRGKDDEGASVGPILDQEVANRFDINDFHHFRISQEVSHQEVAQFDLDAQFSVLQNAVNINRHDVKSWLEFIDLQRQYHAKNESGDLNAPIQNEKAYYERVMEIIRRATGFNQTSPEIQIKKLKVMEGYLGRTSDEVKNEWSRCENRFINNLNMWKDNLKMRMNDRTIFSLNRMLGSISKCISKLVRIKLGIIRSHPAMEGTDEFLVDLLISYCALLISTGFIDRAVVMLQALAEFHFFNPLDLNVELNSNNYDRNIAQRWSEMLKNFRTFWESGFLRVGDFEANGWCNIEEAELRDRDRRLEWTIYESTIF